MKNVNPKLIAALVAAVLGAVGVYFPEYASIVATLAGTILGKEFLPQSGDKQQP